MVHEFINGDCMVFEYFGFELDKDYYQAACERIKTHTDQLRLI